MTSLCRAFFCSIRDLFLTFYAPSSPQLPSRHLAQAELEPPVFPRLRQDIFLLVFFTPLFLLKQPPFFFIASFPEIWVQSVFYPDLWAMLAPPF